jgi:hypothetical protein
MFFQYYYYPSINNNLNQKLSQNKKKNEIINLIETILSYENLNKDIYIRSCINKNGFISINNIQKLEQIKKFNLSNEEFCSLILNYPSQIYETTFENYEIMIRNKKWCEMEKYLFSIDDIIKNKVNKIQNYYLTKYPIQNKIIKPMERRKK